MKKKLFGNKIDANCAYCNNSVVDNNDEYCVKYCSLNKEIINGKCKKFDYNPLLRVPKGEPTLMEFAREDFEL